MVLESSDCLKFWLQTYVLLLKSLPSSQQIAQMDLCLTSASVGNEHNLKYKCIVNLFVDLERLQWFQALFAAIVH